MLNNNQAEDLREIFNMTTKYSDEVNHIAFNQMSRNGQNQGI